MEMSAKSRVSILSLDKISLKNKFNLINNQTKVMDHHQIRRTMTLTSNKSRIVSNGDLAQMTMKKINNNISPQLSSQSSQSTTTKIKNRSSTFRDRPFEGKKEDNNATTSPNVYDKYYRSYNDTPTTISTNESIIYDDDNDNDDDDYDSDKEEDINNLNDDTIINFDNKEIHNDRVSIREFIPNNIDSPKEIITNQPQTSNFPSSDSVFELEQQQQQLQLREQSTTPRASLQSTELSELDYHKLDNTINTTSAMMINNKMSLPTVNSNAWNDDQDHHYFNNNNNQQKLQMERLMMIQKNIYKKDRMTIFCFCASALGGIASLAIYCTQ